MIREWEFGAVRYTADYAQGWSRTEFPDGACCWAVPHATDDYRATAERLGYAGDTAALSREHEFCHNFLARRLFRSHSPTLWAVAHPDDPGNVPLWQQEQEEALVMEFQRCLNEPAFGRIFRQKPLWTGYNLLLFDLDSLRREALWLLRGDA